MRLKRLIKQKLERWARNWQRLQRKKQNKYIYSMNTAAANTVVHNPSLFPSADWQILEVLNIWPLALYICFLSSHALFISNSIPRVVASIVAARSSAYSPAFFAISPNE